MNPQSLSEAGAGLLFNWRPSRRRKLSIISFVIASIALHAFGFYLFQIIYPPAVALLPAPGRVSVISPTTEEGRLMLRWIEAEDPALGSTTQRPSDAKAFVPPKVAHVPTFATHQPALRESPPFMPDVRAPDAQPPGPVSRPRASPGTSPQIIKTAASFSVDAERLGALQTPAFTFKRSNNESPAAAQFRVAISRTGEIRFCFLETSSGDAALDEQARQYLTLCQFIGGAVSADLVWTTATVVWGNDLAPVKPAP